MINFKENLYFCYDNFANKRVLVLSSEETLKNIELKSEDCKFIEINNITKNQLVTLLKESKKRNYILITDFEKLSNILHLSFSETMDLIIKNINKETNLIFNSPNIYSLHNINSVNNKNSFKKIRERYSYNKNYIEEYLKKLNLYYKFFYVFPNINFPEIILTDEFLNKKIYVPYKPVYFDENYIIMKEEIEVYKEKYDENMIDFHANDYLIEVSFKNNLNKINFMKFNNYRNETYNLFTLCINEKYYKKMINEEVSKPFYNRYINSSHNLKKIGFKTVDIEKDEIGYYTKEIKYPSFCNIILEEYNKNLNSIYKNFKIYKDYVFSHYKDQIVNVNETIFDKYKISLPINLKNKLNYVKKCYVDIIPQNMICCDKEFFLIDQEWILDDAPLEYILYRGIINTLKYISSSEQMVKNCMDKLGILEYLPYFYNLELAFHKSIENKAFYKVLEKMKHKTIYDENEKLNKEYKKLNIKFNALEENYNKTINSKSWKITKPLRRIVEIKNKIKISNK